MHRANAHSSYGVEGPSDPGGAPRGKSAVAGAEALLELALCQDQEHAVVLQDPQGRVIGWFAAASRVFGYSAEEVLGGTLDRLFTEEDLARGEADWALRAAAAYGKVEDDRWHVRKDGLRIWVSGVVTALHEGDGRLAGFVRVARDRTDLRGHMDVLQRRLEQAVRDGGDRNVVYGTLAHELRNPLAEISNAASILRALGSPDPRAEGCLRVIERQVGFIDRMLRDLLETARMAVGKAMLQREALELREVIDAAVESCRSALDGRGQAVEVLLPNSLAVEVDRTRMQQVIVNLLTNASKFSPRGARIWLKAHAEGQEVVLRVEDPGRGIAPELMPRIFELFTQTGDEGARPADGIGLGLGLVKSIVELHGGTVQARSEGAGRGAELVVRLPMRG